MYVNFVGLKTGSSCQHKTVVSERRYITLVTVAGEYKVYKWFNIRVTLVTVRELNLKEYTPYTVLTFNMPN